MPITRHVTLHVEPGVNLAHDLRQVRGTGPLRVSKAWLRDVMRRHPEWDWHILTPGYPAYVNGNQCVEHDITLKVDTPAGPALINFQHARVTGPAARPGETTIQAVVR